MSSLMRGVFIVGCKRTAFGAFGGKIKDVGSVELGQIAARAALEASKVSAEQIDSVTVGNIISDSQKNGTYISRHIALGIGARLETPCLTVNRLCGSGFQATVNAAQDIVLRDSEIALAVGTESMSQAPFVVRGARFGVKFSQTPEMECSLWSALTDWHARIPMAITAENLAEKYSISREDCDNFALLSQKRWADAQKNGKFKNEIVPVMVKVKGKEVAFDVDEHPKPATTMEILSKLPTAFKKNGVVTAGNASGVNDGAAALVLASEDAVKKNSLTPLARVVGYCSMGVDPTIMGIGPAPSIRKLLEANGLTLNDIDVVEVNEAFAAQFLAVQKELGLDLKKTNVNGGAIALGHPLAASGARILTNLVNELKSINGKYAIGSACIGGGQGISVLIENIK
ncbi:PREDICTED: 3-ketoacyl-CoA thiolase, mitochondrial-like [Rhagoletis zephyria]|uniref:3-ketoacyl-CoA thiolase, mitochondrial-like n=1 Tax=Rhagoletis zephyria TaxID=28612 RepID=UPI00081128B1|nr:PREDICTED: 3-ketoacyl-CoA thiolase, mitochondrial-like [Rhagoletis zephyria]